MQLPTSVFLLFCTTVVLKYQGFRKAWPSTPHPNQSCSLVASCFISSVFSVICPWPSEPFKEIILVWWSGKAWSLVQMRHCSAAPWAQVWPGEPLLLCLKLSFSFRASHGIHSSCHQIPLCWSLPRGLPEASLELGRRLWGRHQAPGSRHSFCTDPDIPKIH